MESELNKFYGTATETGKVNPTTPQRGTQPIMNTDPAASVNGSANSNPAQGSFQNAYQNYADSSRGQTIGGMYDAQTQAELAGLKATYDQNLSNQQYARDQISGAYQGSANNLQAQYERNRRNLNTAAAANGINTGAGSQQQLALNSNFQRDYGALKGQEAQAITDAERAMADLKVQYQNAIQQANAQGDYRKMAALLDDYNTQYNNMLQQAQLLASYGDFSGFSTIPGYTEQQINNMRNTWIAQNPLLAYNTGAITASEYYKMTGKKAPGTKNKSTGNNWYPGWNKPSSSSDTTDNTSSSSSSSSSDAGGPNYGATPGGARNIGAPVSGFIPKLV